MRRLGLTLFMTFVLITLSSPFAVEATILSATKQSQSATRTEKPIVHAACRGWGAHCPPGYVWNGYRCVPC
jgi:hypothetical protein